MIVAHNRNEGLLFTDSSIQNQTALMTHLQGILPSANFSKINQIATALYPNDLSGVFGYVNQTQRLTAILSDALTLCNVDALHAAYSPDARSSGYNFDIFPGIHAQDIAYTFYNGQGIDVFGFPIDRSTADLLQSIIVDFTISGNRSLTSLAPQLPGQALLEQAAYPPNILALDVGNRMVVKETAGSTRCKFWQEALYPPLPKVLNVTDGVQSNSVNGPADPAGTRIQSAAVAGRPSPFLRGVFLVLVGLLGLL